MNTYGKPLHPRKTWTEKVGEPGTSDVAIEVIADRVGEIFNEHAQGYTREEALREQLAEVKAYADKNGVPFSLESQVKIAGYLKDNAPSWDASGMAC